MQYSYGDWVPSQSYYAFAKHAGRLSGNAAGAVGDSQSIFNCLVSKDTAILKNSSAIVGSSGMEGTWALPVTDGTLVQELPSQQLQKKQANGVRILSGVSIHSSAHSLLEYMLGFVTYLSAEVTVYRNNANEGPLFVSQNITTEQDLVTWLRMTFLLFTEDDISKVLRYYPSTNASDNPNAPHCATLGYTGDTAINESSFGAGQQQRVNVKFFHETPKS